MNSKRPTSPSVLSRSIASIAAAALVTTISTPRLYGASGSWNVDVAGNWGTAANWNPAAIPGTAAGDVVNLNFDITAARTVTIDTTSRTVGDLNIGDPAGSPLFGYTLASSALTVVLNLDGTATTPATVDFQANIGNTISAPLTLVDNAIFRSNVATPQVLSGIISGAGKSVTFNNDTDGTVNPATALAGQFTVSGANTYTGGTTLSDVRVNVTNNLALGAAGSAVTIPDGAQVFSASAITAINYAFNVAGNGWVETAAGQPFGALRLDSGAVVTGPVTMSANSSLGSNAGTGTINGVVSGAFALTKVGAGILALGGSNTFSGGTTVANGSLQLNNANAASNQPINVVAGGTIGTRILVNGGVTVANAINIVGNTFGTAGQGTLQQTGTGLGTFTGPISITGSPTAGGHFVGGLVAGNTLVLSGPITSTVGLSQRDGFVRYGGGGTGYTSLLATGTVQVGATDGIPTAATVTLGGSGNATLDLNGFDQTLASVSVGNGTNAFAGTINLGAKTLTLNGDFTAVTSTGTGAHAINGTGGGALNFGAINRNLVVNDNPALDDLTVNGAAITGTGGVTKLGTGTLALNGATVAGPLTIGTGALATGTGSQAGSFTAQSLSFADGTTLRMKIGASGDLINTGALATAGTTTVSLNQLGGIVPVGSYPLIKYTGTSPGLAGFALSPVGHATATLVDNGSTISLNVTGNSRVIWDGTNSTSWATGATGNWKLQTGGAAADYIDADDVIFQDSPANSTVTTTTNVSPSNVTFTNTAATAYTISGTGGIVGSTGLTKTGNGVVTLSTPNSYTGPTNISAGTLNLGGGTLAGSSITVASGATFNQSAGVISGAGATLATAGATTLTGSNTFTGDITLSGGTLIATNMTNTAATNLGGVSNPSALSKTISITNNAIFRSLVTFNDNVGSAGNAQFVFNLGSGGATFDTPAGTTLTLDDGAITGNASNAAQLQGTGNLTKTGDGTLSLGNGTSNYGAYTGQILISQGTLTTGSTSTNPFGSTAVGTTIAPGAALDVKAAAIGAEPLTISGTGVGGTGVLISSVTGGSASGPITLAGDSSVGGATALGLSGPISGAFSLNKIGAGTMTLSNPFNSYGGSTTITTGVIAATVPGALPATTDLILAGGTLDTSNQTHTVASISGSLGGFLQATAGTGVIRTTQATSTSFNGTLTRVKVDMSGTGTLTLGGTADNSTGTADVNSGTLILGKTGDDNIHSLGAAGIGLIINAGGTAQIAGSTSGGGTGSNLRPVDAPVNYSDQIFNFTDLVINAGGTLDLNDHSEVIDQLFGAGTIRSSVFGSVPSRLYTNSQSTSSTFAGSIKDGNGIVELTKLGTGTLTLTGVNTYSGVTNVAAGRLEVNGALASSSITVADGASLGGEPTIAGVTLGSAASGNVYFNPNTAGALTVGALTVNGAASTVDFATSPTGAGPWTAIKYTTKTGAGSIGLANAASYRVPPVVTDTGTSITVNVTGTKNEAWTGSVGPVWDSGATVNTNWNDGAAADNFFAGDTVTFGDGPTVTGVTVTSGVAPFKTTVNSNTNNYTLTSTTLGIAGPGNLEKSGSSTLTLVGPNTYGGQTVLSGGTLSFSAANSLGGNASIGNSVAISGGARLSYTAAAVVDLGTNRNIIVGTGGGSISHNNATAENITISGNLIGSGTNNLSFQSNAAGAGTFILTGDNSGYTGRISVDGPAVANGLTVLRIAFPSAVPAGGSITLNYPAAGTASGNATTLDLQGVTLPAALTLNLTSFATAALSLRTQLTGTGNTIINGPITIAGSPAAGTTSNPVVNFAPTLGTQTINGNITEGPGGFAGVNTTSANSAAALLARGAGNTTFNGTINLPSAAFVRVDNTGITTINSTGNVWALTDVRSASTLRIGANNALSIVAPVNIGQNTDAGDSILDLNGFNQEVAGITSIAGNGANARRITNSSATLSTLTLSGTVDRTFGTGTAANEARITGNLALVKNGTFTETIGNTANSYTGPTTINAGTLLVSGSISASAIAVNTGGTLGGTGSVSSVSVGGGTVAPGASASAGTLTAGPFSLTSNSFLKFDLATPGVVGGANDLLSIGGAFTLDGTLQVTELSGFGNGTYRLANYTSTLTNNGLNLESAFLAAHPGSFIDPSVVGQVNLVVVPEPASILSLLAGVGILGSLRRHRRQ